jgi:hypothetical protein
MFKGSGVQRFGFRDSTVRVQQFERSRFSDLAAELSNLGHLNLNP